MKIKKAFCMLFALMLSLICLASCGSKDAPLTKLTVSEVTHSVFYAPQYAAIALGYFEDEGLEVELINGGGADNVMTSVLSGQVDIGFAGPEAAIYVVNEGKANHPRVFAQVTQRDGSFLISREMKDDFTYSDMSGKHLIGGRTGGVPLMTLNYVLDKNGLKPGEVNVDTSIEFNNMVAAFSGGIGDYVTAFEPTASMLEQQGLGYVVASIGEDSGDIPYTVYFASDEFLTEHRETAVAFTRAIYKAQQWIQSNDSAIIAEVIAPFFADTDIHLLTASVDRYKAIDAWCTDPVMTEKSLNNLMDVMEFSGELSERPEFTDIFDVSIPEEAKLG